MMNVALLFFTVNEKSQVEGQSFLEMTGTLYSLLCPKSP